MIDILSKYDFSLNQEDLDKRLSSIQNNLDHWMTSENSIKCLGIMDLTTLNSTDTIDKVTQLTNKVNSFNVKYPNYPTPASICVYPNLGKAVKDNIKVDNVNVIVVAGGFPTSQSFLDVKIAECKEAVKQGADEVDIVLALNKFLVGDYDASAEEIREIKKSIGKKTLKVILETGALKCAENIAIASFIAMENGADFIKTSTGKLEPAATPMAALIMCDAIKAFYKKTGKRIGFKPAGGMVVPKDAICYLAIVDTILGKEWLNSTLFRLGASRLANNLLSELEESTVSYY